VHWNYFPEIGLARSKSELFGGSRLFRALEYLLLQSTHED
jgi:hypothetical protein